MDPQHTHFLPTPCSGSFPNTNQTKHCWQNYVDYYKCINARGEDFAPCKQFFRAYHSLCPNEWVCIAFLLWYVAGVHRLMFVLWLQVSKWDEQRENGSNPSSFEV
jgi:cytochrome c oxidase subunit 6b